MSQLQHPTKLRSRLAQALVASAVVLAVGTPAAASAMPDLDDLKSYFDDAKILAETGEDIIERAKALSSSRRTELKAKLDRAKLAAKGLRLFVKDVADGKPAPFVLEKASGTTIACGDEIWMANTANDKVLQSEDGNQNKTIGYIRVNLGWNGKSSTKGPNVTIKCKDKSKGEPLMFGDKMTLRVEPGVPKLDDGKPYMVACTECGYEPNVRLDDMDEIKKYDAYWTFEIPGASGVVPTGIPLRLIATNRGDNGDIGGFCGSGPAGVFPVVRFNFHNHCNHAKLAAAIVSEGVARPPRWLERLAKEVKAVLAEVKAAAG
jgi:hypothetical protein